MRIGKWKLVARGRTGPWELYDMEADRTELNDLAARDPGRVRWMAAVRQEWAERAHVVPWPGGRRRKKKPGKQAKPQEARVHE